jgi:hypothetical protein
MTGDRAFFTFIIFFEESTAGSHFLIYFLPLLPAPLPVWQQ